MTISVMQVLHQGGGAGSVTSTLHLSIGLARRGAHVRFVCPPDSPVEREAREAGLEVHALPLLAHERRRNAGLLLDLLTRAPVDLVNSQSARDRQALTLLGLTGRLPCPAVFTRRQMPRTFWLENWLASRAATRMIAVSRAVARALERKGTPRRKVVVVHNGLVTARIDRPVSEVEREDWRQRISWTADRPTLGIVSRPKDQAVVLRALALVERPVRLVLAGVGENGGLRDLAARATRHEVVFLPFDPDVRPLYDLLDLVLLPTRMEGLSQALLEAMALGLPVVASDTTSNPEVIRDGENGRLVRHGEPAAWARAITQLLGDPAAARRLGEAARHTAREDFSLERTVDGTMGVYEGVMSE